ncbi:Chromate transporter [Brevibacillus sp. IT-7CA2]
MYNLHVFEVFRFESYVFDYAGIIMREEAEWVLKAG